jgi:hypothetical protein
MRTNWIGRSAKGIGLLSCLVVACVIVRTEASPRSGALSSQPQVSEMPSVGADNIGGVVTSSKGPEAGVWVIAETSDFQTKLRKIVVTDDQGRYLLPELPKANYKVWVRGYGLVDSTPVPAVLGKTLALKAVVAPDPRAAAQVYPANYWLSMLKIPPKDAFPMQAATARSKVVRTQGDWIDMVKEDCEICHQLGDKATREIPASLGTFPSVADAWKRRVLSGQIGGQMLQRMNEFGFDRGIAMFADWTERINAGEVPPAPPRPQGIERNVVLTLWDIGTDKTFFHSLVSTNKWNPRENAKGPVYEGDWAGGTLNMIDPLENTTSSIPVRLPHEEDRKFLVTSSPQSITASSPYWGDEMIWDDPVNPKNTMIDRSGKLWISVETRRLDKPPDFCKASSGNVFAKAWEEGMVSKPDPSRTRKPWESFSGWGLNTYDPKTHKFEVIDLCYGQSHPIFANDKDETIYFSLHDAGIGWFNTRIWNQTRDASKAQGWCAPVIDYNGDGKTGPLFTVSTGDARTTSEEPPDPKLDRLVASSGYGVAWNPIDHSIWYAVIHAMPGKIMRQTLGSNPPSTCATEVYEPPFNNPKLPGEMHFRPRGLDIDSNGLIWTALAGSGELASFDRSKCKGPLNGPTATGQHCPEGWTLYPAPGPMFKGTDARADYHYFNWVDLYNTIGLGQNVSVVLGTGSDSLKIFKPQTKEWFTFVVPYPMGLYTRNVDGRIDDPTTGWKGRGLWAATETRVIWHAEGGKGQTPQMVHFQLRPDPLAR